MIHNTKKNSYQAILWVRGVGGEGRTILPCYKDSHGNVSLLNNFHLLMVHWKENLCVSQIIRNVEQSNDVSEGIVF